MASVLLVESGSTKTDWCLISKGKKPLIIQTSGINPLLQTHEDISTVLKDELKWNPQKHIADSIVYYGSGAGHPDRQKELAAIFKKFFAIKNVKVHGDLLAAAHALCGNNKGIVSILGTGSNSCYYNGKDIKTQQPSLGFIAGDEGSGNHLGKRVLQYYAYKTFDAELMAAFEQLFGDDIAGITRQLYKEPFPNRYLASFVPLLIQNRGHYMVENIIEDCINDFFHYHILKFRESWKLPLHFTGSVAYEFKDVILSLCEQYELEPGLIQKSPMDGLIQYHKQSLSN